MNVNKLSIDDLREHGKDPQVAMTQFREWIIKYANPEHVRPVMVTNGTFDTGFISWYFSHFNIRSPFSVNSLDMKSMYFGLKKNIRWSQTVTRSIRAAHPETVSPSPATHHALDDALDQAHMFVTLRDLYQNG